MTGDNLVLAAVDGSDHSLKALDWALQEARFRGAEVLAVHVGPGDTVAPATVHPASRTPGFDRDLVRRRISEHIDGRVDLPALSYTAVNGPVAGTLAELAQNADLMVLGSRGLGGFRSLLLGSVGRKSAAHAPCPVVIVPDDDRAAEPAPPGGHGLVVLGMEPEETGDEVVEFAFAEARSRGARLQTVSTFLVPLTALAVVGELAVVDVNDPEAPSAVSELSALQTARLAPFRARYPDVAVQPVVRAVDPAGQLVDASVNADLVVVGRHRRRLRADAMMMGSVTGAVVAHAHGPIAVIPPRDA
ncbi:universal stress protein [Streptomyces triticagri]|uniref:Universal stress protein n=1 Tax=Streptomyces triticagri TaxID=2293568 RepID=A0A372M243_9ACTN|nr:universal stress protein [Streptomyces triticagri]RFU84680.1 universal stress protein [Streptomyces triticagri]